MEIIDIIGFTAGTLTTCAALPQIVKTWKTKKTKDISLGMFSLLFTGMLLWVIYAAIRQDYPLFAANVISSLFVATILYFKLRYK
ncbi:MAG: SemiSWEET transporter [Nitrospinae bacterium]|nr:SemiSWEET transporter [Nitrospinota bacterium]